MWEGNQETMPITVGQVFFKEKDVPKDVSKVTNIHTELGKKMETKWPFIHT